MMLYDLVPAKKRKTDPADTDADWENMSSLQQDIFRMFDNFFRGFCPAACGCTDERVSVFTPCIDVLETADCIKIRAELPGMAEKDITTEIVNNLFIFKGEKKEEDKKEIDEYRHRETACGSFRRVVPLTARVDGGRMTSVFARGILEITLPKVAAGNG